MSFVEKAELASEQSFESLDVGGDIPKPRFGHTTILISKTKVILFGGAISNSGKFLMCNESFLFNINKNSWFKLNVKGEVPSSRAAHAAVAVDSMQMLLYGGATEGKLLLKAIGGNFASEDLYLLDLQQGEDQAQWIIIKVTGQTPGKRYGHTMTLCKPYLYVFGGNTGTVATNDLWCLNIEKIPFTWVKVQCNSEQPTPRVYHSAAQCLGGSAAGMLLIFGGRTIDQSALNDTWGLRQHSDGTWDWVKAPYKPDGTKPLGRFQHSSIFIDNFMAVIGGRTNSTRSTLLCNVYDTETAEWFNFNSVKRFRHGSWLAEGIIYVFGGFQEDLPNSPSDKIISLDYTSLIKTIQDKQHKKPKEEIKVEAKEEPIIDEKKIVTEMKPVAEAKPNANPVITQVTKEVAAVILKPENKGFLLSSQAQAALSFNAIKKEKGLNNYIQTIPVAKLKEAARKLGASPILPTAEPQKSINEQLCMKFINSLLNFSERIDLKLYKDYIIELAREFNMILELQPIVINIRAPLKVFGSLYGNFNDLIKIFELWKPPTETSLGGDIDSMAYLFLGNYVDRTRKSLETICLLMALKLKYPDSVYLLRGSHEDATINELYGFGEECSIRLEEDINNEDSVFQTINKAFTWLPLAAVVENKILCIHGGIGPNITKVEDLNKVNRPIKFINQPINKEQSIFIESIWSDPAVTETETGFKKDVNTDHTYQFGSDVLNKFLDKNDLEIIIRTREIAPDGFDTFADSRLITLTSCTDYAGTKKNSACIIVIKKTLELVPKLLLPYKSRIWIGDLKKCPPLRPKLHS